LTLLFDDLPVLDDFLDDFLDSDSDRGVLFESTTSADFLAEDLVLDLVDDLVATLVDLADDTLVDLADDLVVSLADDFVVALVDGCVVALAADLDDFLVVWLVTDDMFSV
jgi:hypothetical protein